MPNKLRNHIRANVVGYVAVFIALSGAAYAGSKVGSSDIKKGAVKSKHLKDGKAVKSKDIKDGEVSGADIADGGVSGAEIADGGVSGAEIADGSVKGADVDESSLAKVPNADTLDGLDASAFAQGPGTTQFSGGTIADATTNQLLLTLDIGTLDADCNTGTPSLIYTNQSGGTAIVIRESRGDQLTFFDRMTVADTDGTGFLLPDATDEEQRHQAAIITATTVVTFDMFFARTATECEYSLVATEYVI